MRRLPLLPLLLALSLGGALVWLMVGSRSGSADLVVYAAQDQVYAEPLLAAFSRETGIGVRPVFDSEAAKTVGLAHRLIAERDHPICDVFWGNEELRVRQLAERGVWRATAGWAAMGWRSRRIVINTNFVSMEPPNASDAAGGSAPGSSETSPARLPAPRNLRELTNSHWRARCALAYPLFGTTATHFLALRQHWGATAFDAWCRSLVANRALVVDGNSAVARLVARGEAWVGLTDSDDIAAVRREGAPVVPMPLDGDSLLIPNTVAVTRDAPRGEMAERLYRWLQRPETVTRLVELGAIEGADPVEAGVQTLRPDWGTLVAGIDSGTARFKEIFLR